MKELAKLHASGHAFLKMFKGGISQFLDEFPDMEPQPFFRSPIKDMDAGLRGLEKGALEAVKAVVTEEPLQKRLAAFIEQKDTLVDRCHVSREGLAGTFPVIQHGDLWNNNILFKDSDETAAEDVEVKFIDLQFVKYSEVATDLVYFFWSSTTPELRRNHEVELLRLYHHHLNMEAHAMLNEDIDLSFDSLKNSYERLLPFGFTMACIHAQLQIVGANNENSTAPFNFGEFDGHNMDSKLDMMTARMTADLKDFVSKSRPALNRINSLVLEASTRGII